MPDFKLLAVLLCFLTGILSAQSDHLVVYESLLSLSKQGDTLAFSWRNELSKELNNFRKTFQIPDNQQVDLINEQIKIDSGAMAKAFLDLGDFYKKQAGVHNQLEAQLMERSLWFYHKSRTTYASYLPDNHTDVSVALNRIGRFYRRINPDSCFHYYKQVLDMRKSYKPINYDKLGAIYNNLGTEYWIESNFEKSYAYFLEAIETLAPHVDYDSPGMLRKFVNLSLVCTDLGLFSKAIEYASLALPHVQKSDKAHCLNNLGIAYLNTGQIEQAITTLEKANTIIQDHNIELQALIIGNLAEAYSKIDDFESAKQYYIKSNALSEKLGSGYEYEQHTVMALYAKFLAGQGQLQQAKSNFEQVIQLSIEEFGAHHMNTILLQLDYVESLIDQKEFIQATTRLHEIDQYGTHEYLSNFLSTNIDIKQYKLRCLLQQEKPDSLTVERHFLDLESLLMNMRLRLFTPLDQISFNSYLDDYYDIKVNYFYQKHKNRESVSSLNQLYAAIENAKSNALNLHLTAYQNIEKSISNDDLKERFSSLRSKIRRIKSDLLFETDMQFYTELQIELSEANNSIDSIVKNFTQSHPQYFLHKNSTHSSISSIQSGLDLDEALIQYYEHDAYIMSISITQDSAVINYIKKDNQWKHHIESVMDFVSKPQFTEDQQDSFKESSHSLYTALLPEHLRQALDLSKIKIVPHKSLEHFPFDVLLTDAASRGTNMRDLPYLLKRYSVSYRYLSTSSSQDKKTRKTRKTYGGFAPEYNISSVDSSNYYDLPFSRQLMSENLNHLNGDVFIGEDCTKANLIKFAQEYAILHISSHTHDTYGDGLQHKLLLSEKIDDSQTLGHAEIMSLDLDTKLVILSSCNSGRGEFKEGEGAMHLSRSFSFAGAESVLMSFWSLPDQESALINLAFLEKLSKGAALDVALRDTKLDYIKTASTRLAHPYFWSGLALIGNTEKITIQNRKYKQLYFIAMFMFLIACAPFLKKILT